MSYGIVNQAETDKKQTQKTARKIEGRSYDKTFVWLSAGTWCGSDSLRLCLVFRFRKDRPQDEILLNQSEDDCHLDQYEKEHDHKISEFVEVPSFVAVIPYDSYKPVYIIKITGKGEMNEEMQNRYGHSIALGELLKVYYLKPERSRNICSKNFGLIAGDVPCEPEETLFTDIESDLSMSRDAYLALIAKSS